MSESPPEPKLGFLRRALKVGIVLGTLVCLLFGGARAYFSDERLKTMLESQGSGALGQTVTVKELELSIFNGFKIHDLVLGTKNQGPFAVKAKLIDIGWSWAKQSTEHVGLDRVSIQGLEIYQSSPDLEPSAPDQDLAAEPAEPSKAFVFPPIHLQEWPVLVSIENINLELQELHLLQGVNEVKLKGFSLRGALALGEGLADADFRVQSHETLAHLFVKTSKLTHIDGVPRVSVNLATQQGTDIKLSAKVEVPAHGQTIRIQNETTLNIPRGKITAELFELAMGEHSHLKTSASIHSIYTQPNLETGQLVMEANFDALQPLLDLFEVPAQLKGIAKVSLKPVALESLGAHAMQAANLEGLIQAANIFAQSGPNHLQNFNGDIAVRYQEGRLLADSTSLSFNFDSPAISVGRSEFELSLNTLVNDWVLKTGQDTTEVALTGSLSSIANAEATIKNLNFTFAAQGPTAILQDQASNVPFTYTLDLDTAAVRQSVASLGPINMRARGSFYDLRGDSLQTTLDLASTQIELTPIDGPMAIEKVQAHVDIQKRANHFVFTDSALQVDTLASFNLDGAVTLHSKKLITATKLRFHTELKDLQALKARLPPNPELPKKLAGQVGLKLELSGTIPVEEMLNRAKPPAVPEYVNAEQWESDAGPLVDYVGTWMRSLSEGLSLDASLETALTDIDMSHQGNILTGFNLNALVTTKPTSTHAGVEWRAESIGGKAAIANAKGVFGLKIKNDELAINNSIAMDSLSHASLVSALHQISLNQKAAYRFGKDLNVQESLFKANGQDLVFDFSGLVYHPIRTITSGALLKEKLPGVKAALTSYVEIKSAKPTRLVPQSPTLQGGLKVATNIAIENGALSFLGEMECNKLTLENPNMLVSRLNGKIPVRAVFESYNTPQNMSIVRDLAVAGGAFYLRTDELGHKDDGQRQVYYEDLRPYRPHAGIEIGRLKFGDYELSSMVLDARIENGTLSADHFSTELLGGDVLGNLRFGLNAAREIRGSFSVQASNIDASHFSKLNLEPGPDSELSADMRMGIFISPTQRDINLDVHVTQIGKKTLDRFLQLLDPDGENPQIQKTRGNLKIIEIHEVTAWIRHENLNMDLDYTTLLSIPGTDIGFRPIDRELLRRYTLTEQVIDPYFQSYVDRYLAKSLGWNHATP